MGGDSIDRLNWKNPLHSLEVELQTDFGLSPVSAKALIQRISLFLDTFMAHPSEARGHGQILYPAVAVGERAGKPLKYCITLPVNLTVLHPSDAEILHNEGSPALRIARIARACSEAYAQGAVLSHEDLSLLWGLDLSSVRRLVKEATREGSRPPTRGLIEDIGPTISHKEQVIHLYFRGLLPAHIAARTGHSLSSVERYLADFARVSKLHLQKLPAEAITRITQLSPKVVRSYFELLRKYEQPAHKHVIERLLCRFGPVEPDEGVQHG